MRGWFSGENSDLIGQGPGLSPHSPLFGLNILLTPPTRAGSFGPEVGAVGSPTNIGVV